MLCRAHRVFKAGKVHKLLQGAHRRRTVTAKAATASMGGTEATKSLAKVRLRPGTACDGLDADRSDDACCHSRTALQFGHA